MYYDSDTLREMMNEVPFKPFRVIMSNGRQYDVPHHDAAFVTENKFEIGLDLNKKGVARRSINCAIAHIASVEEIEESIK